MLFRSGVDPMEYPDFYLRAIEEMKSNILNKKFELSFASQPMSSEGILQARLLSDDGRVFPDDFVARGFLRVDPSSSDAHLQALSQGAATKKLGFFAENVTMVASSVSSTSIVALASQKHSREQTTIVASGTSSSRSSKSTVAKKSVKKAKRKTSSRKVEEYVRAYDASLEESHVTYAIDAPTPPQTQPIASPIVSFLSSLLSFSVGTGV